MQIKQKPEIQKGKYRWHFGATNPWTFAPECPRKSIKLINNNNIKASRTKAKQTNKQCESASAIHIQHIWGSYWGGSFFERDDLSTLPDWCLFDKFDYFVRRRNVPTKLADVCLSQHLTWFDLSSFVFLAKGKWNWSSDIIPPSDFCSFS